MHDKKTMVNMVVAKFQMAYYLLMKLLSMRA